jgi:hypothetical protein
MFLYRNIGGGPFTCAVCLPEFDAGYQLRLLPECGLVVLVLEDEPSGVGTAWRSTWASSCAWKETANVV